MSRQQRAQPRYDFGRNWEAFATTLTDAAISHAIVSLRQLTGPDVGKRFLDIGSGSGVHSLAALRLGAQTVRCLDYDADSVATTRAVLAQHAKDGDWDVKQADILVERADIGLAELNHQLFDTVYSWGVLHHTGDMWRAIDNAATFVKPDGRLVIALYLKTPFCGLWRAEKYIYAKHPWVRPLIRYPFALLLLLKLAITRRCLPGTIIRDYRENRGMSLIHDVDDWLGGYPYESANNADIVAFLASRGFDLVKSQNTKQPIGIFGSGCGEWVFRRSSAVTPLGN